MPRSYINRQSDGTAAFESESQKQGIGGKIEAVALGNTNFDDINNPITSFNFVLEVEGVYFLALKSVRAFTKENEYEYIREGGVNDYVHMKRKPISKPFTFQIERYVGTERFLDPLANGTELILPLILYVYRHATRAGITESGSPAWPSRVYTFTGCTVMSKEYGALDSEKSGLVTETTTIAYRELVVLTNPFNSLAENPEWNPKDDPSLKQSDSPGYKTKYAATSTHDKHDAGTYKYKWVTEDGVSRIKMKDDVGFEFAPSLWNGDPKKSTRPKKADPDVLDETYEMGTVEGQPALVRKSSDTSDFNRPQYEFGTDGSKAKYARQSPVDSNEGERIYADVPGPDGKVHKKRVDHAANNKPAWSGEKDTKVSWAAQSRPDIAGNTYSVERKDGSKIIKRKDSGQFNQEPYDIATDKTKNKRAKVSSVDKNSAAPIYKVEKGHMVRKDKSEVNKGAYDIDRDRSTAKYAHEAENSHVQPIPREPYSIEEDGSTPKYAKTSKKDKPLATPVTWPPTRRALMAENLKK